MYGMKAFSVDEFVFLFRWSLNSDLRAINAAHHVGKTESMVDLPFVSICSMLIRQSDA